MCNILLFPFIFYTGVLITLFIIFVGAVAGCTPAVRAPIDHSYTSKIYFKVYCTIENLTVTYL